MNLVQGENEMVMSQFIFSYLGEYRTGTHRVLGSIMAITAIGTLTPPATNFQDTIITGLNIAPHFLM